MWKIRFQDGSDLLYEGPGTVRPLDNDGIEVSFEYDGRSIMWQAWKDRVIVHSRQDVAVRLPLVENETSLAVIESPFGTMEVEVTCDHCDVQDEEAEIRYRMEGMVCSFRLEWKKEE